jgi:hypothetical protein
MKEFEIGRTYTTTSICNHDCELSYTITARTAETVTATDNHGETHKFRISKKLSTYRNAETFLPWGNYSMCPMISAE